VAGQIAVPAVGFGFGYQRTMNRTIIELPDNYFAKQFRSYIKHIALKKRT
jgi:hypothetical protein